MILLAEGKNAQRQADKSPMNSNSANKNLIEKKQADETYAEFRSIFKEAGLEKILESKSGAAEFETLGNSPARYRIVFSDDEIKFNEVKNGDKKSDSTVENRSITYKRDEGGDYQPVASAAIPDDLHPEAVARYIRDDAVEKIGLLKTSELGKNIIVTRVTIENESATEIGEINRANLERYVSCQIGRELAAEIAAKTAAYDETKFKDNADDERLKVIADIGRGEETREISRADLLRERQSIALSHVNNARRDGTLKGMVEDEGISLKAVEKRQYRKETIKAQAMQKPWVDALDKTIAVETVRLEGITAQADLQLKTEKANTGLIIKQIGIEDTKHIKPALPAETIWLEQIRAVKRFDTETFAKLEEIHQASGIPRPNDVYARLRGMETIAKMKVRQENINLVKRFGKEATEENIVINLRRESGELKLEAWRVKKTEQPPEQFVEEIHGYNAKVKAEQVSRSIKSPRPLPDKINPSMSSKTDLSWINNDQKMLNPFVKPIEPVKKDIGAIKKDEGLQIVRAVAGYIDWKNKNEQLADLTEKTLSAAKVLGESSESKSAANAARLSEAVGKAVLREEALRENLRLDKSLNCELLETPEPGLHDAEMKQIGKLAVETSDAKATEEFYNLIRKDAEFAAAIGETEERLAAGFFLAEARAVCQSNNAIEQITPLNDGSINIELNPAHLTQAIDSFRTVDAYEEFQPAIDERSVIRSLSLEEISQAEQFLPANNQIAEFLDNQTSIIAKGLMENLEPPLNQSEQEMLERWTLTQEVHSHFERTSPSEQFLDSMERQGEIVIQNQIPFQEMARNFTPVNQYDEAEAEEKQFWRNEREQREERIAREKAQARLKMTDDEKAVQDAIALDEIAEAELAEQDCERAVLRL